MSVEWVSWWITGFQNFRLHLMVDAKIQRHPKLTCLFCDPHGWACQIADNGFLYLANACVVEGTLFLLFDVYKPCRSLCITTYEPPETIKIGKALISPKAQKPISQQREMRGSTSLKRSLAFNRSRKEYHLARFIEMCSIYSFLVNAWDTVRNVADVQNKFPLVLLHISALCISKLPYSQRKLLRLVTHGNTLTWLKMAIRNPDSFLKNRKYASFLAYDGILLDSPYTNPRTVLLEIPLDSKHYPSELK